MRHEKGIVILNDGNLPPLLPPGVHAPRTCLANLVAHSLRCLAHDFQLNKSFFYVKDSLCLHGYLLAEQLRAPCERDKSMTLSGLAALGLLGKLWITRIGIQARAVRDCSQIISKE
ncbi:hypothetical protein N8693_00420 [Verrucomicrobia bacterium]|nr:hypothetical protein [Verrucomicrobiota bacterium]